MDLPILPLDFYKRDCREVSIDLLGKYLHHETEKGLLVAKIVETEAYLGKTDPACHYSWGITKRTAAFEDGPGTTYIFTIYGQYLCLNAITLAPDHRGCVLIRALEPVVGIDLMRENRPNKKDRDLTNGPGKLCIAMDIKKQQNRTNYTEGVLTMRDSPEQISLDQIRQTERIGLTKAKDWVLRYIIEDNQYVTRYKPRFKEEVDVKPFRPIQSYAN